MQQLVSSFSLRARPSKVMHQITCLQLARCNRQVGRGAPTFLCVDTDNRLRGEAEMGFWIIRQMFRAENRSVTPRKTAAPAIGHLA